MFYRNVENIPSSFAGRFTQSDLESLSGLGDISKSNLNLVDPP